ncbi:cleavage and polyadenylation specificity factor subunit [Anaeramoeba flamelloides]|uniref:Cleavage and polyadenylation specificity factor subunit n=1 Tax=Anaeramoeba flamelloides TaxID=1746091 RepID=A0AAV7ZA83_9EUKA|nr:cleavage and polyadenylation specificity factor subunit [Anaeramoeba flamelloides]
MTLNLISKTLLKTNTVIKLLTTRNEGSDQDNKLIEIQQTRINLYSLDKEQIFKKMFSTPLFTKVQDAIVFTHYNVSTLGLLLTNGTLTFLTIFPDHLDFLSSITIEEIFGLKVAINQLVKINNYLLISSLYGDLALISLTTPVIGDQKLIYYRSNNQNTILWDCYCINFEKTEELNEVLVVCIQHERNNQITKTKSKRSIKKENERKNKNKKKKKKENKKEKKKKSNEIVFYHFDLNLEEIKIIKKYKNYDLPYKILGLLGERILILTYKGQIIEIKLKNVRKMKELSTETKRNKTLQKKLSEELKPKVTQIFTNKELINSSFVSKNGERIYMLSENYRFYSYSQEFDNNVLLKKFKKHGTLPPSTNFIELTHNIFLTLGFMCKGTFFTLNEMNDDNLQILTRFKIKNELNNENENNNYKDYDNENRQTKNKVINLKELKKKKKLNLEHFYINTNNNNFITNFLLVSQNNQSPERILFACSGNNLINSSSILKIRSGHRVENIFQSTEKESNIFNHINGIWSFLKRNFLALSFTNSTSIVKAVNFKSGELVDLTYLFPINAKQSSIEVCIKGDYLIQICQQSITIVNLINKSLISVWNAEKDSMISNNKIFYSGENNKLFILIELKKNNKSTLMIFQLILNSNLELILNNTEIFNQKEISCLTIIPNITQNGNSIRNSNSSIFLIIGTHNPSIEIFQIQLPSKENNFNINLKTILNFNLNNYNKNNTKLNQTNDNKNNKFEKNNIPNSLLSMVNLKKKIKNENDNTNNKNNKIIIVGLRDGTIVHLIFNEELKKLELIQQFRIGFSPVDLIKVSKGILALSNKPWLIKFKKNESNLMISPILFPKVKYACRFLSVSNLKNIDDQQNKMNCEKTDEEQEEGEGEGDEDEDEGDNMNTKMNMNRNIDEINENDKRKENDQSLIFLSKGKIFIVKLSFESKLIKENYPLPESPQKLNYDPFENLLYISCQSQQKNLIYVMEPTKGEIISSTEFPENEQINDLQIELNYLYVVTGIKTLNQGRLYLFKLLNSRELGNKKLELITSMLVKSAPLKKIDFFNFSDNKQSKRNVNLNIGDNTNTSNNTNNKNEETLNKNSSQIAITAGKKVLFLKLKMKKFKKISELKINNEIKIITVNKNFILIIDQYSHISLFYIKIVQSKIVFKLIYTEKRIPAIIDCKFSSLTEFLALDIFGNFFTFKIYSKKNKKNQFIITKLASFGLNQTCNSLQIGGFLSLQNEKSSCKCLIFSRIGTLFSIIQVPPQNYKLLKSLENILKDQLPIKSKINNFRERFYIQKGVLDGDLLSYFLTLNENHQKLILKKHKSFNQFTLQEVIHLISPLNNSFI